MAKMEANPACAYPLTRPHEHPWRAWEENRLSLGLFYGIMGWMDPMGRCLRKMDGLNPFLWGEGRRYPIAQEPLVSAAGRYFYTVLGAPSLTGGRLVDGTQ